MLTAKVIGHATSTVKHPSLEGWKLLVVQPLAADGRSPDGEPVLAVDMLGAGRRDKVIISSDGKSTREVIGHMATPIRWATLGVQDN